MKEDKLIPKRRFKEFINDEAWEQRKLGEVADIIDGDRGKNYPSDDDFSERGHTLFLSATNVTKDGFSFESNQYITDEKSKELGNGKLELNDIILTSRGSLGHVAWYNSNVKNFVPYARINSGMLILRSKEVEPSYIAQYLKTPLGKGQIDLMGFGSAQPQLTKKDISNYNISAPGIDEQVKLGAFFANLNNLITLHQRKLKKLKNIKLAYLSEMFPKEGEKYPKRRFDGFTDPWEQRKVKDIFKVTRGYVLAATKTTREKTPSAPYPVYSSQTSNQGLMGYYKEYLYKNAITWTTDGANAGTVNYREGKFYCTNVCGVLISEEGYANKMISEALNKVAWKHVSKVGNPKLMNNVMSEIAISIPKNMKEQSAISNFFSNLDNLITLHQRKLDKLENIKKAYLNEMFV